MSLRIAGMGWVTPLGRGIEAVWRRLLAGEEACAQPISSGSEDREYPIFPVPNTALKDLPQHPRLRRASAISRFAAAAALDALEEATATLGNIDMQRIAVVFAVSNGGVAYTKRFYHDVAESGAQSASPLLFPETVFNAPASHLTAILGIVGASYTLVGDGAVGILAMKMAEDLMMSDALDYCLVVGAEEADWLLCDAYHKWRLLKMQAPIEPFCQPPRGMILTEGAGAIVLARKGAVVVDAIHAGTNFSRQKAAADSIAHILRGLAAKRAEVLISSANGTFIDLAEHAAAQREMPEAIVYSPKPALGESVGASAIWQTIIGAQSLATKKLAPLLHLGPKVEGHFSRDLPMDISANAAIVLNCGLNQQVAGLKLSI
jgi:3-oxoacyl-(acyl-carrier-protein) synthase